MPPSVKFELDSNAERLAELEERCRNVQEALHAAHAHHELLQSESQLDELKVRRSLGRIQWLQGRLGDLQEALERHLDGVYA